MPQLQTLVLTDRATTPVNHSFVPRDVSQAGVGTVVENTGVPVGESRFSVSTRRSGRNFKSRLLMAVPVVQNETINGITKPLVVRTGYVDCTFTFDESSTEQERNDVVGMFASCFAPNKLLVNDAVVKLQGVY